MCIKRALRMLVVAALAATSASCATSYTMAPQTVTGQTIRYDRGNALVASDKEKGAVRVSPAGEAFQKRLVVAVVVFNKGTGPASLSYDNIRITTGSGTPLVLVTYERLTKEAKTAAAWQAFAVALSASASAYSAAQPTTATTTGSYYGSGGAGSYTSRTTIFDPAAAQAANQMAQANANRQFSNISTQLDDRLASLGGEVLRKTTIDPGQANGGQVVAQLPKFAKGEVPEIRVLVDFNGETHEFRYTLGVAQ